MTATTIPTTTPDTHPLNPALIVFGLDDKAKSHASWFPAADTEAAASAAAAMGMATIAVDGDELGEIARTLPRGKLYESGKAFVPFVSGTVADRIRAHLPEGLDLVTLRGEAARAAAKAAEDAASAGKTIGKDWGSLVVNDLVLVTDGPGEGWWEAFVEQVVEGKLILRWRDWPGEPGFARLPHEVALLPQRPALKAN